MHCYTNLSPRRSVQGVVMLVFLVALMSVLLAGCGGAHAPVVTASVADAHDVKARSQQIQRQIAELFPAEYTTKNELDGPDESFERLLLKCKPILSDDYWNSEDNKEGVQYTGGFTVRLDDGAPVASIVDQIYQDIIHSPDIDIIEEFIPENPTEDVTLYTTDGYEIRLSYVLPENRNRYSVSVYVWSPCFIPETMPPSRKI